MQGTFLEGKVVVPVSSVTNKNIPLLMEELAKLIDRVQPHKAGTFMPIDRAFPISALERSLPVRPIRGK